MRYPVVVAAAFTALLASAGPSAAQYAYQPRYAYPPQDEAVDILPPYEIANIVRSMGFNPVSPPRWRPGQFVMRAIDPRGQLVRLIVDAHSGRMREIIPLERTSYYEPDPYQRGPAAIPAPPPSRAAPMQQPYDDDDDTTESLPGVTPPRVIPGPSGALTGPKNATAPATQSAKLTPPKTPMPRARPAPNIASEKSAPDKTASAPSATSPATEKMQTERQTESKSPSVSPAKPADDTAGLRL